MEGILCDRPRISSERTGFWVPRLKIINNAPTFAYAKEHNEFRWTSHAGDIWHGCDRIETVAAFMQSSLFFGLLAAFLNDNVALDPDDFTADGHIELNTTKADARFRRWRARCSLLGHSAQKQARAVIQSLITFASKNSEVFEEVADRFGDDETFDRIALSVRLLINLLSEISNDTFALIGPPSGMWRNWARVIWSRPRNQYRNWIYWTKADSEMLEEHGWRYSNGSNDSNAIYRPKLDSNMRDDYVVLMGEERLSGYLCDHPNRLRPFSSGVDRGGRAARLLYHVFLTNGWCPYRALQLCRSYDYLFLNLLAGQKRPFPPGEDHTKCLDMQRCRAHNIDLARPEEYPVAHHEHGVDQRCDNVHIPVDELIDIIESGSIPLISLSREGPLDLQVVRCTPFIAYTAISHVWSDGMGNPQSNSLPECQLLRLRKLICDSYDPKKSPFYDDSSFSSRAAAIIAARVSRAMHAEPYGKLDKQRVYFWMDTLCIPILTGSGSQQRNKDLKFMAMKHLTPIFAGATNTLVLEKGLQAVGLSDSSQLSGDEFAGLVLSSKWMQRGWTLEEGALSMHVVFHMAGQLYPMVESLYHALPHIERHQSPLVRADIKCRRMIPLILKRSLLEEKQQLANTAPAKAYRIYKHLRILQFVWTWNSLLERSVTKREDGALILANLLDFNVSALKMEPAEEQLRLVIQSCEELPLSLLYNTGPRLCGPGEPGWIPEYIEGDRLTTGAVMRQIKLRADDGMVTYSIDRSGCDPRSLCFLHLSPDDSRFHGGPLFIAQFEKVSDSRLEEEYVIQVLQKTSEASHEQEIPGHRQSLARGACVVIDLRDRAYSRHGFAGRGARLWIKSRMKNGVVLEYDAPLTAWTLEQWQYRFGPLGDIPRAVMAHIPFSQSLHLKYGMESMRNTETSIKQSDGTHVDVQMPLSDAGKSTADPC